MAPAPTVTIGMPVYNGERHIAQAIESIRAQTHRDLRLIILDNASTDRTGEIALDHAARDPRVVYLRNPHNIGAGPNFNRVFTLADTPYFKWAAHDDELHPKYLEACVRRLDRDPSAVLAHSLVEEIDDAGRVLRVYAPVADQLAAADPLTRFRTRVLQRGWCTEVFGLMRASKLRGSALIASFAGADLLLIAELTLRGRFVIVPEPLFRNRVHPSRYTNAIFENVADAARAREIMSWYDTSKRPSRRHLHWWLFLFALFPVINRNLGVWRQRLPYYGAALRWMLKRENRRDLAKDLLFALSPGLHGLLWRVSRRPPRAAWLSGVHLRLRGEGPPAPEGARSSTDATRPCRARCPHVATLPGTGWHAWLDIVAGLRAGATLAIHEPVLATILDRLITFLPLGVLVLRELAWRRFDRRELPAWLAILLLALANELAQA